MSRDPKRNTSLRRLVFVATLILALPQVALAANSVVIESRTFSPNQPNCSVGVYLQNDFFVFQIDLVLEIRSESGGAYFAPPESLTNLFFRQRGSHLDVSPLGSPYPHGFWCPSVTSYRFVEAPGPGTCTGPQSHSWMGSDSELSGVSPDGVWFRAYAGCGDESIPWDLTLDPGADSLSRRSASWLFTLNTNGHAGCFVIDTACYMPSIHTAFFNSNGTPIPVSFTKATICIDPDCFHCYCQGDSYECDKGWIDIIDVVRAINVSFRGEAPTPDPSPVCRYLRTDIDCDGSTDLRDIVGIIDVAFHNQPESVAFCNTCP